MRNSQVKKTAKIKYGFSQLPIARGTEVHDVQDIFRHRLDPLPGVTCRISRASEASIHASMLNRATAGRPARSGNSLLQLQRQYGNRYVQCLLALARKEIDEIEAAPELEQSIQQACDSGQALNKDVQGQMEAAFDADFSGVRVHSDTQADKLNRELNARAFTTGQDIFFRQGAHNPGSSSGRELLAHELTHVVQQTGDEVWRKLTVGEPGDRYEQEADQTARAIMQREQQPVQRESDEGLVVRRQVEEEEKPVQTKLKGGWVHLLAQEEEETLQAKTAAGFEQRQLNQEEALQSKTNDMLYDFVQRRIDGETIYREVPSSTTSAKRSKGVAAVLIATVTVRKGDKPQSILTRALIELGLPKEKAQEFSARLTIKLLSKPIAGKPYPVYLSKATFDTLKKEVEAYEEGRTPEGGVTKGEGEGDGLGLIEVPPWVVKGLKVLDAVLTVVGLFTGAAAAVSLLKIVAKKLIKWAVKRAVKKAAKETAKKVAREALKRVSKKAAREGLQEAIEKITKEATKRQIRKSAQKAAKEALRKSMKKASKKEIDKLAKELAEEVSEELSKKVAKSATKKAIKEATKGFLTRGGVLKNARKAKIPLDKLTKYSLNPNHPVGGGKAKIIKKLLGYDNTNYAEFLRQLKSGVAKNKAILGKADRYGTRLTVYIKMTGPNGKAVVESGWIFKPGSSVPQLVTVFIPK